MIFRNIFKKKRKKEIVKMKDVIFAPQKEIIRLKEKIWHLEISKKKINNFITTNKKGLLVGGIVCFVFIFVAYSFLTSKAEVTYFYPSTALGGWENSQNAQGVPDLEDNVGPESFNVNNSAVLRNMASQIFLGNFQGNLPDGAQLQKATLKISWAIKEKIKEQPIDDVNINEEFPIITPTPELEITPTPFPTDEFILEPSPSREPIFVPEVGAPEESQQPTPMSTPTPISTPESTPTPTPTEELTSEPTPTPEPTLIPTLTPEPTIESTPENSPVSWWHKLISKVFAEEVLPTPTPEPTQTPTPTPEPTPTPPPAGGPTPELTPTPESTIEASLEPTIEIIEVSPTTSPTGGPTESVTPEPTVAPAEDLIEITYSLDGMIWNVLARINRENWQNLSLEIPNFQAVDLQNLQISFQSLPVIDQDWEVYLDGVSLEIVYQFEQTTEEEDLEIQEGIDNPQESPTRSLIVESINPTSEIINTEIISTPKPKRKIDFDFKAKHSCQIEPFNFTLSGDSSASVKVLVNGLDVNKNYELILGDLPVGVEAYFVKNSSTTLLLGKDENESEIKITNHFYSQKGSFNLMVIFQESDNVKKSIIPCQFNLIIE